MVTLPSVCPLDCPDRCSLSVDVDGDRVVGIDGSHVNPMTGGVICAKVRGFGNRVHGPLRLRQPAVRVGPKGPGATFRPVSWAEALDLVAERFRAILAQDGPEALLPYWYAGSNGLLTGGALDQRLWNRLGTTQILRTFCAANTGAGARMVYGDLPGADPSDIDEARFAILWGVNPSVSGIHLVPKARAVRARGGRLVVVDPRRTPLARQADLHLRPLPGTDVAVALALGHLAFREGYVDRDFLASHALDADAYEDLVSAWSPERAAAVAEVPADDLRRLAAWYAESAPAFLRAGWGMERNRNGTDAVRAVLGLPAVYGKFGVRGGGYALSTTAGYRMSSAAWLGPPRGRTVNMTALGQILEETRDPPIRGVYVYDCNPMVTAPDQVRVARQLARDDLFVVVHEQVHTDTCDYADVLLPATTFLEHEDLTKSYSGYLLQWAEPVIPPVGEARSNHAVVADLAERLGHADLRVPVEVLAAEIAETVPQDRLLTPGPVWPRLKADGVVRLAPAVQFRDLSAPIALVGEVAPRYRPPPTDAHAPLILVSPASRRAITSTLLEDLPPGSAAVDIHPDDAAARGVRDGDEVRMFNHLGEVWVRARVTDEVRPGVVCLVKGLWRSATKNGWTACALAPAHVDEHGGGACYNDARVELVRATP